jgi:hypothetical protein
LQQATGFIAQKGLVNPNEAGAASSPYLRMFALVAIGFMWLKMAKVSPRPSWPKAATDGVLRLEDQDRALLHDQDPAGNRTHFRTIMAGAKPLMDFGGG